MTPIKTTIRPVKYGVIGWIFEEDSRLKPLDLPFLDRQLEEVFEKDVELNRYMVRHPLSVALVKLSNRQIRVLLIDTSDPKDLDRLRPELITWYEDEGIRTYSLKRRFDQDGFIVTPLMESATPLEPRSDPLPEAVGEWSTDIPMSLAQLKIEEL